MVHLLNLPNLIFLPTHSNFSGRRYNFFLTAETTSVLVKNSLNSIRLQKRKLP